VGYKKFFKILALIVLTGLTIQFYLRRARGSRHPTFIQAIGIAPTSVNPFTLASPELQRALSLSIETLAYRDPKTFQFAPLLASSWQLSKDQKSITIQIRPDVRWHDGQPLTIEDVAFSIKSVNDPAFHGLIWGAAYKDISKIEPMGENRLRIHWHHVSYENLTNLLHLRILPKHIYTAKKKDQVYLSQVLIGSGPYRFEKIQKGRSLLFRRHLQWWGQNLPQFKGLYNFARWQFLYVPNTHMVFPLIKKGELHYYPVSDISDPAWQRSSIKEMSSILKVTYTQKNADRVLNLFCNLRDPLLSSLTLRKALNQLVPREEINEKFFHGERSPISSPWGRSAPFLPLSTPLWSFNQEAAYKNLTKDGWIKDPKMNFWIRQKDDKRQLLRLKVYYYQSHLEKVLTYLQEHWKQMGLDLSIQFVNSGSITKITRAAQFQLLAYEQNTFAQILRASYHSEGSYNTSGLNDEDVDLWLDKLKKTFSLEHRTELEKKVAAKILAAVPEVFILSEGQHFYFVHSSIQRPQAAWPFDVGLVSWSFGAASRN
jgi:ABC-type transport system substrate-binding protein